MLKTIPKEIDFFIRRLLMGLFILEIIILCGIIIIKVRYLHGEVY